VNRDPDLRGIVAAAVNLSAAGNNEEALRLLESAGREGLAHPVVRNLAGDIYLKLGRKRDALRAFDTAVRNAPDYPEAHGNRGVALQQLGRIEEAVAAFDRALKLRPAYAVAHFNRGNALRDLHRNGDAIAAYGRAIAIEPRLAEARVNRGRVLLADGSAGPALDDFGHALRLRPHYREAEIGRMEALRDLARFRETIEAADRLLLREPDSALALSLKALALLRLRNRAEALAVAEELVRRHPEDAIAHWTRSAALRELIRFEEALAEATEAAGLAPRAPEPQLAIAAAHGGLGDYEAQLAALARAEKLGAAWRDTAGGRAGALANLGRGAEADALSEKLLAAFPDDPMLAYNRADRLLQKGDYRAGFAAYESRLAPGGQSYGRFEEMAPRWRGEGLAGKRLLVHGEQGLGDNIQFARFLPRLAGSGANIVLEVARPLRRLLAPLAAGMTITDGVGTRSFDAQVSIVSLAHRFDATVETLPPAPYLAAEPELAAKWRDRIGDDGFRIGIVWQGNVAFAADRFRSLPLALFAPLAALPGVRLVSLQAIHGLDQLDRLPAGMAVERLGPETADPADGFSEIAGAMAALDLVVSIDSSVAHLAGALGRPVWTLLRAQPEWRWIEGRTDTPWYSSMRLFRQKELGNWEPVIAGVVQALEEQLAARG